MAKYLVKIVETLTYNIEVEAENEEQAENEAFSSSVFNENLFDENDAEATEVNLVEE